MINMFQLNYCLYFVFGGNDVVSDGSDFICSC